MKREPLGIEHQSLLAGRLKEVKSHISEYCFPNLYLYRQVHRYEVLYAEELLVAGVSYDVSRYVMPMADLEHMDIKKLVEVARDYDYIYPVPEERLHLFKEYDVSVSHDEGESDYIYLTSKMSLYPGRWLHRKRNLLKQFERSYRHEAYPLTEERIQDAVSVLNDWLDESGQRAGDTDYSPCLDALKHYEELVLCGGMYYADGAPAGFVVGEELSPDTFLLHYAKGLTRFKGVYQYMFSSFASILPSSYRYINIEQDLNIEALRRAKRSYRPEMVLKKMRVAVNAS